MRNRVLKYCAGIVFILFLAYNSVYFRSQDEIESQVDSNTFDASTFARSFYDKELLAQTDSAVELAKLIPLLLSEREKTFDRYSHALAIGNIRYFLVKGEGTITSISDDAVVLKLKENPGGGSIRLATEFVYGNAVRDACGLVRLDDFTNTSDLNKLSESINEIIRNEVLPPFVASAKPGRSVRFAGAIELHQKHPDLNSLEVVPIRLLFQD